MHLANEHRKIQSTFLALRKMKNQNVRHNSHKIMGQLKWKQTITSLDKNVESPGRYLSVGWAPSHKLKGRWFDSRSGHIPGLQPGPQSGSK